MADKFDHTILIGFDRRIGQQKIGMDFATLEFGLIWQKDLAKLLKTNFVDGFVLTASEGFD